MAFIAAAVAAVGAVASTVIKSKAAKKASKKQASAEQQALDFQKSVFAASQKRLDAADAGFTPFAETGTEALSILSDLQGLNGREAQDSAFAQFRTSPGFSFRRSEGEKGIIRGAQAVGLSQSGRFLKDIGRFNQNIASQEFNSFQAGLGALADVGFNAAGARGNLAVGAGNIGVAAGSQIGQTFSNLGAIRASGTIGSANAVTEGIQNLTFLAANAFGGGGGAPASRSSGSFPVSFGPV